jgi:hypothetical protein
LVELFNRFKPAEASDPFCDPNGPFELKAKNFHFENDSD